VIVEMTVRIAELSTV